MTGERLSIRQWTAPGPVAQAFYESHAFVQAIMGPVGGGKTSTVIAKFVKAAAEQAPSRRDKVRRIKVCVVRDTYRRLWRTTLPSIWYWLPKSLGKWTGADGGPATFTIRWRLPDAGGIVELNFDFVAIGDDAVEDVLRGYEPTFFWLNEADRLSADVLTYAIGRVPRFPSMEDGGATHFGIVMDYNAPDTESYLYKLFEEDRPEGYELHKQPSGLSPQAENLANLHPEYYENQKQNKPWYVRRMVENKYGFSRDGKPVYETEFDDAFHVAAQPLRATAGLDLLLGADAGRTPALVAGQLMPNGQWRILAELAIKGMGATVFGEAVNRLLAARFAGWPTDRIRAWGDPAAANAGDQDERSWLQIVSHVTKIAFRPAPVPGNSPTIRLEAVRRPLLARADGGPAFLLSPDCVALRKGFNSEYKYKISRMAGSERVSETPDKNEYSHVHDALQYLVVGGGGYGEVMDRASARANGVRQTRAAGAGKPAEYAGPGGPRQTRALR